MVKSKNYLYYLICLLPILDIFTSLQTRFLPNTLSIGLLVKGIIILVSIFYVLFKSVSKYRKFSCIYYLLIFLYIVFYYIFKPDLFNFSYFFTDLTYLIKIIFMPIIFTALINFFSEYGFDSKKFIKSMVITLITYVILLIIPISLGLSFNSYNYGLHGVVGWFYAANEISVIMILLLPFMYFLFQRKYSFLISLPILYTICSIGTKVSFLGTLIVTLLGLIFSFIIYKGKLNNHVVGSAFAFVFAILFCFIFKDVTIQNTKQMADYEKFTFIESTTNKNGGNSKFQLSPKIIETLEFLLSNRDEFFYQTRDIFYARYEKGYSLFGMGFSNSDRINNENIVKLIEIDYLDIFYHAGILGLVIVLTPLFYGIYLAIKSVVTLDNKIYKINNIFVLLIILMLMAVAAIAGHILFYPAVSIYLALYLMIIFYLCRCFTKKEINENKITFLALHLKNGGIETVLVNRANMLSSKYNVEIVSLYKIEQMNYQISDNIKITYLMNDVSNKEEFLKALKDKNIKNIFKEGYKALKILYLKPRLIKQSILDSDSKVIISTRSEFAKLLGKYKREKTIAIGEEHNYKLDDSYYVSSVIKNNKNMDYFMPTSKELTKFYDSKLDCQTNYIPNVIALPDKKNILKNHKIMAIGRLSKEKGFIDLVKITKSLIKYDKNITIDLYGDGEEKENILKEIKLNKLEKNLILKGNVALNKLNLLRKEYSIIISTSYMESFGLAVLESMAYGIVPVIYNGPKGLTEFINEENGIIINNRSPKQMAKEINNLMHDKKLYQKLSENAYQTSLEYSKEKITPVYQKFIKDIIYKDNQKKILFISSTGGHLTELFELKPLFDKYNYHIITEKTPNNLCLKKKYKNKIDYLVYGTKSHLSYLYKFPYNILKSIYLFSKIKPDIVITTGAHTCVPMCYIAHFSGKKVIYIETFANINTKTITGRLIYPIADMFFVQWESMLKLYPNAKYEGWIF